MFIFSSILRSSSFYKHNFVWVVFLNSKIPPPPLPTPLLQVSTIPSIDKNTFATLERFSLLKFSTEESVVSLEQAILAIRPLVEFNVSFDVKPLYSVLEEFSLRLREDVVTEGNCRKLFLLNTSLSMGGYIVAPLSNMSHFHE